MRRARAERWRGRLDTGDRKPDPIPASVLRFPSDLGQIPRAPDFQATSAPVWTFLSRAWHGRRMLSRLESQSLVSTSVPHPCDGHHQGCLPASPFPASFSEVLGWEGDTSRLCSSLGAGGKPFSCRTAWGVSRKRSNKENPP